ncbi:hypothetical protein [Bowmanella denitrificans]|uniref:hypothetical protein n=1 Tax=Bowmanella denitrificans TaxID=366582 RepID=UPI000C9CBBA0|nr:hypothetical protein [Bowmanella denitrificans]
MEQTNNNNRMKFYLVHLIAGIIVVACLLMNGPMRGGLPVDNTLSERMTFIVEHQVIWQFSWCIWMLCALGLFTFCAILADNLKPSLFRNLGLAFVAMGIVPDLSAEVLYAFVIPNLIHSNTSLETLSALEVIATHLTGFLGNGLYNLGGMLLTLIAIQEGLIRSWVAIWGITAWVLGLMLSFSIALNAMQAAELFTATSMVLSTMWMLIFAHKVLQR